MDTQHHVIKRLTVEITLAKKENAWQLQQLLSRIFQQQFPALLDRCLSEAGRPDCLHRIDRLELDLGELASSRLEDELLEKIDAALRQALSEQLGHVHSAPVVKQPDDILLAHQELFEHFIREGYMPWWADSSQRHTPEKSLAALLKDAPNALKHLLAKLIQEPRSLQRLISYFDDSHLIAITALLTSASKDLATSLLQTLSAVQAPLRQHSRMPIAQLRATLWQSLLQVASAGDAVISRHAEFLTAVTVRWAKLQGLSHTVLGSCLQQQLSSSIVINNEWLQAIRLSIPVEDAPVMFADDVVSKSDVALGKLRPKRPKLMTESSTDGQVAEPVIQPMAYWRELSSVAISNRYPILSKLRLPQPKPANASSTEGQTTAGVDKPIAYWRQRVSAADSNRYAMLKIICGASSEQASKTRNEPLVGDMAPEQSAHTSAHSSLLDSASAKNSNSPEDQANIETANDRLAFSDSDAVYINNAGLCILWPFLAAFFERLELVQNGRFHNQAAKQCGLSLLYYLTTEELNPPEYLLPLNKLLCGMAHNEVFDFDTSLTAAQIEACDELLAAVIDNAPILNNMSVNGFRGSFLLRRGSLSAGEGSWLLRVERESYDLVLERFPWSWQWFKLPWMEYPLRVEW